MRFPHMTNEAWNQAERMYYMYRSDFFPIYRMSGQRAWPSPNYGPAATYDFSSDLFVSPMRHRSQTVEDVIRRGYLAVPRASPEMAIISDRQHTSKFGLGDIIGQIRKRYELFERNVYEIELAKCEAISCLYRHRAYHGPTDSKVEYSVSKRLNDLYSDQREERTNLWRDISRLRQSLPESAQQYLAAYRKIAILKGDGT